MRSLKQWIKEKLKQGYSIEEIKKALSEEHMNTKVVDEIKKEQHRLVLISMLIVSILFISVVLSLVLIIQEPKEEVEEKYCFYKLGLCFKNKLVEFKDKGDFLIYTYIPKNNSNMAFIKITSCGSDLNKCIKISRDNLKSIYKVAMIYNTSLKVNNQDVYIEQYLGKINNRINIIKNAFISNKNRVIFITLLASDNIFPELESTFNDLIYNIIIK